jgi:hypothetical protein
MNRKITVFTYVDRYSFFLDKWIEYYTNIFKPEELLIVYSNVTSFDVYSYLKSKNCDKISVIEVNSTTDSFIQRNETFNETQILLLKTNDVVVYSDVDELIFHPYLRELLDNFMTPYMTTKGFEIIHSEIEPTFDPAEPILKQREYGIYSSWYNKPLIVSKELYWEEGKHNKNTPPIFYNNLLLIHINKIDINLLSQLNFQNKTIYKNVLSHNANTGENLNEVFKLNFYDKLEPIPKIIKDNILF